MPEEFDVEMLKGIQSSQEGLVYGLGAISEVLQKMESRLRKQEEKDEEVDKLRKQKMDEEEEDEARKALVKDIAYAAMAAIKAEFAGLLPVDGRDPKTVGGKDQWPMSGRPAAEDEESPASVDSSTETVQKPIQAQDMMPEKPVDGEEGADEYPMEEDEMDEDAETLQAMRKELRKAQKESEELRQNIPNLVKAETEKALKKMGWREEKGFKNKVVAKSLGAEAPMEISKSEVSDEETLDALTKRTHKDLWRLRLAMESQNSRQGIPQ